MVLERPNTLGCIMAHDFGNIMEGGVELKKRCSMMLDLTSQSVGLPSRNFLEHDLCFLG